MPDAIALIPQPRYPAFGIPIGEPEKLTQKLDILQKCVTSLSSSTAIASFAFCSQIPALIILGILSSIAFVAMSAIQLFLKLTEHKRKICFSDIQIPASPVGLGQWSNNNDVIVSNRVDESFQFKKALICQARKSLEISFNYGGGAPFQEVLGLLDERMALFPELKVHFLISSDILGPEDRKALGLLRNKYGERLNYVVSGLTLSINPRPHLSDNHCKMIIVDSKYFGTGGSGVEDRMVRERLPENTRHNFQTLRARFLPPCLRDTDVFGKGDMAHLMREQFFRLYHIWEYRTTKKRVNRFFATDGSQTMCPAIDSSPRLVTQVRTKFLISGPEHRANNPIVQELTERVSQAQREVVIATPNFLPHPKIAAALSEKLRSRVNVTGVFNGISYENYLTKITYCWPTQANYNLLSSAYELQTSGLFYHKKVYLIDDRYSMVGTFNFSQKSNYWDYEDMLMFDDARVTHDLKDGIEEDQRNSKHIQGEELAAIYNHPLTRIKAAFITHGLAHFTS